MPTRPIPPYTDPDADTSGDPFAMLEACHARVHACLSVLRSIGARVAAGQVDAAVHGDAGLVIEFFDKVAPHHHEDEEQHVFPCVLASTQDGDVRAAVLQLQEDHQAMESQWARLRVALAALANGHAEGCDGVLLASAQAFCVRYEAHARLEDAVVFPVAIGRLDGEARAAMGREMIRRRLARGR